MRLLSTVDRLTSTYYSTLFLIFPIFGKEISEIFFFIENCIFFSVAGSHSQNGVCENMIFFFSFHQQRYRVSYCDDQQFYENIAHLVISQRICLSTIFASKNNKCN